MIHNSPNLINSYPKEELTAGEKELHVVSHWIDKVTLYILVIAVLFLAGSFLIVYARMPGGDFFIGEHDGVYTGVSFIEAMKAVTQKFEISSVIKAVGRRMGSGKKDFYWWILEALKRKIKLISGGRPGLFIGK